MVARFVINIIEALLRGLFVRQHDHTGRRLQALGRSLLVLCVLLTVLAYVYYDSHGILLFCASIGMLGACLAGGGAALYAGRTERKLVR